MPMILALSVALLLAGPPEIRVYADPGDVTDEAAIREAACPYLRMQGVPVPAPTTLYRWKRVGEGPVFVAVPERTLMLQACP
jgi:hypothetical protein